MATGDIFKITLHGTYSTITPFMNVFYYKANGPDTSYSPASSLESFVANLFPATGVKLLDNIHSSVTFTLAEWAPVTAESYPIGSLAITKTGLMGGEAMPSFCAYAFRYYPRLLHRRSGYKRFCGMPEGSQASGILASSLNAWGVTVSTNLGLSVLDGDSYPLYYPVIASFTLNGELRPIPVTTEISDIKMNPTVATQNTRKR